MWYLWINDLCKISFGELDYAVRMAGILCCWLAAKKDKNFDKLNLKRMQWERDGPMNKSIQHDYFTAKVSEQHKAWELMYQDARRKKITARYARMYVRCYHYINSGNAHVEVINVCPSDVDRVLTNYAHSKRYKTTREKRAAVGCLVYNALGLGFGDIEYTLEDYVGDR